MKQVTGARGPSLQGSTASLPRQFSAYTICRRSANAFMTIIDDHRHNSQSPNFEVSSFILGIGMTSLDAPAPSPMRTRVPSGRKRKMVLTGFLLPGSSTCT